MKNRKIKGRAVVLLSGGLDSGVTLYKAIKSGYKCFCLVFDYGQRHKREINSAKRLARRVGCSFKIIKISLPWGGSALLDRKIPIPGAVRKPGNEIPLTYVPGRNIIFLSFALSYAESIGAGAIYIGAHAQDYSGYPDCRPKFFRAFRRVVSYGTRQGVKRRSIEIKTPLINKTKAQIVRMGLKLNLPFELTWSCYRAGKFPCGSCDSCYFRQKGFGEAGIEDPSLNARG